MKDINISRPLKTQCGDCKRWAHYIVYDLVSNVARCLECDEDFRNKIRDQPHISLQHAKAFLEQLGIRTQLNIPACLLVNRDDMCRVGHSMGSSGMPEDTHGAYGEILSLLKVELKDEQLFWGGKDDNWLWLERL